MIKIVYVITDLSYGGAQTMLLQMMKNIDREKYEINVIVREKRIGTKIEEELDSLGIACQYLNIRENDYKGSKLLHKIKSYRVFKNTINEIEPDIIHSHLEAFYSILYCLLHNINYVFTIHSFPDRIMTRQFRFMIKLLLYKKKINLVGCAECVSTRINEIIPLNHNVVKTIYNPVDYKYYNKIVRNRQGNKFVHVGRLEKIKNQQLLIEAFAKLLQDENNCILIIVGDGPLRQELEEMAIKKKIEKNILFLGNRADVNKILAESDVFVLSSDSECCPMSILEAMASGLPIISTDVGGIGELVEDAGMLVPKGDCLALSNAMKQIIEDKNKLNMLGSKASKLALNYESSVITNQYTKLYNEILKNE